MRCPSRFSPGVARRFYRRRGSWQFGQANLFCFRSCAQAQCHDLNGLIKRMAIRSRMGVGKTRCELIHIVCIGKGQVEALPLVTHIRNTFDGWLKIRHPLPCLRFQPGKDAFSHCCRTFGTQFNSVRLRHIALPLSREHTESGESATGDREDDVGDIKGFSQRAGMQAASAAKTDQREVLGIITSPYGHDTQWLPPWGETSRCQHGGNHSVAVSSRISAEPAMACPGRKASRR